jgi:hypothetical protein
VPTHRPLMIAEREVTITRAETVPGECRGGLQGSGLACLCVLVLDLINSTHWTHHARTHTHTHITHTHTHTHRMPCPIAMPTDSVPPTSRAKSVGARFFSSSKSDTKPATKSKFVGGDVEDDRVDDRRLRLVGVSVWPRVCIVPLSCAVVWSRACSLALRHSRGAFCNSFVDGASLFCIC